MLSRVKNVLGFACIAGGITIGGAYMSNRGTVSKWLAKGPSQGELYSITTTRSEQQWHATVSGNDAAPLTVVCIADTGAPAFEWWPIQQALSRRRSSSSNTSEQVPLLRVVTYDRGGCGYSPLEDRGAATSKRSASLHADQLHQLLTTIDNATERRKEVDSDSQLQGAGGGAVGQRRRVILVGHGVGAVYASAYARRFPRDVAAVLYVAPEIPQSHMPPVPFLEKGKVHGVGGLVGWCRHEG